MRNNISLSGTGQFACPRGVPICYRPWGEFWTVGAGFRHQKRPFSANLPRHTKQVI